MSILNFTEQKLYAGATWSWKEELDDYPASDGWTLVIHLKHKSSTTSTLTSTTDGDSFLFEIDSTDTAQFTEKEYIYQAVASRTGEVEIVEEGTIEIGVLLTVESDARTDNEIILDAIIATLKGRATREQEDIEFAGRKIKYLSLEELTNAKKFFENEVAKERRLRNGKSGTPRILEQY